MTRMLRFFTFCITLSLFTSLNAQHLVVEATQPTLPLLRGKLSNPALRLTFIKEKSTPSTTIHSLELAWQGTTTTDGVMQVAMHAASPLPHIPDSSAIARAKGAALQLELPTPLLLERDTTHYWLTLGLSQEYPLNERIQLNCIAITTNQEVLIPQLTSSLHPLRPATVVRHAGEDGVHTSRIPALATSNEGTLLAVYDARYESARDLQGHMDIGLKRSFDGGSTWHAQQIVLDQGTWGNLPEKFNGVSDACLLVDRNTGTIFVAALWVHGIIDPESGEWVEGLTEESNRWAHQWKGRASQPGLAVKESAQFLLTRSKDNGASWSEPINITTATKRPEWWLFAPAPGQGIVLKDGTLVFPSQGRDPEGIPFSNITYSQDGGDSWITSNPAYHNTTECSVVELESGALMLNMRDNRNRRNLEVNGRRICTTTNLGESWEEHPTSRQALIEPTCMASLYKHHYTQNGVKKSVLLFSNPANHSKRTHLTIKASLDEGMSWLPQHQLLLDEYDGQGYSCITSIDEETIGILYESSQAQMIFQQIPLQELLGSEKK